MPKLTVLYALVTATPVLHALRILEITCNLGEQEPSVKRGFVVTGGLLT